jgi:4'-phosphopantetheinyl transferase
MTGWLLQAAAQLPPDDGWLAPAERARLAGLQLPARRADWRLGRWTAKLATAAFLGVPAAAVELRAAADGAPEALVGGRAAPVVVSLSHRAGLAVCMVAPAGGALGCDLELAEPHSAAFVADWFTAGEREAVACARPEDRALLLAVLWSAKESALKALRAGLRFDTRWVVVEPPALGPDGSWWPLTVRHPAAARVLRGWWRHDAGRVLTMVADGAPEPPAALTAAAAAIDPGSGRRHQR